MDSMFPDDERSVPFVTLGKNQLNNIYNLADFII